MTFTNAEKLFYMSTNGQSSAQKPKTAADAFENETYTITAIETADGDMKDFLFTLGCYPGEQITVISKLAESIVVVIKDARYGIDLELGCAILIA